MANAYTFQDEECIRWTLSVLGRCGVGKLRSYGNEGMDAGSRTDAVQQSHVNGIVDYSLWLVISHWLYQLHFDDLHFLQQEWSNIELRLECLMKLCCDQETGWFVISDGDWIFIDWVVEGGEKSASLQILWWHTLHCAVSLSEKMIHLETGDVSKQRVNVFISALSETKARLETSFLQMEDVQKDFSRHSHILGIGAYHASLHFYLEIAFRWLTYPSISALSLWSVQTPGEKSEKSRLE